MRPHPPQARRTTLPGPCGALNRIWPTGRTAGGVGWVIRPREMPLRILDRVEGDREPQRDTRPRSVRQLRYSMPSSPEGGRHSGGVHVPRPAAHGQHACAASGASTRELMHRMGHSSMRAALIYQHATSERDREIAENIDRRISKALSQQPDKSGVRARRAARSRSRPIRHGSGTQDRLTGETERPRRADHAADLGRTTWSGRRESNPHRQFGRLKLCH